MLSRLRTRLRDIADDHGAGGWLRLAAIAVLLLNLADAVFTLVWVHTGVATEANVLLTDLVEREAVTFALVKMALVSFGVLLLWRHRQRPLATFGIALVCVAYQGLFAYHLGIAALAVRHALA
jgi:hypothetical protein